MNYYNYKTTASRSFQKHVSNVNNTLKIDEALLKDLLTVQAPSEFEQQMKNFIEDWVFKYVPSATIETDEKGNFYITKGSSQTFPCIVAHMDEVNSFQTQRTVIKLGNMFIGMNAYTGDAAGCPGDDRVGCYTALELLRTLDDVKVAFFVEEEIGGKGSYACNLNFFNDCSFILQADRNGNDEIINSTNGAIVASTEFCNALEPYMDLYNYRFGTGTFTDCGVLANRGVGISCLNLGCGYYDAHSEEEKVVIPDVENILNLMYLFCRDLTDRKWKHKVESLYKKKEVKVYTKEKKWEYNASEKSTKNIDVDFAFSIDEDIPCMTCKNFDCAVCTVYENA